jgi:hypothetical protein
MEPCFLLRISLFISNKMVRRSCHILCTLYGPLSWQSLQTPASSIQECWAFSSLSSTIIIYCSFEDGALIFVCKCAL